MSNISQVKKESNWGDASTTINSNFQNLNTDLEKVKSSTTKFKGYFTSESSLKDKYPSPQSGDTAWVGEPYPGKVYDVQSGQWHNTNANPDTVSIELNDYVNKTEFEENKQQQDEKFTELESKIENGFNRNESNATNSVIEKYVETIELTYTDGYRLSTTSGVTTEEDSMAVSDYIDVSGADRVLLPVVHSSITTGAVVYDSSKKYIAGFKFDGDATEMEIIDISKYASKDVKYVRTTILTSDKEYNKLYILSPSLSLYEEGTLSQKSANRGLIALESKLGTGADSDILSISDYVNCKGFSFIDLTVPILANNDNNFGLCFYDKDKNAISGVIHDTGNENGIAKSVIEIPNEAYFFRTNIFTSEEYGEFQYQLGHYSTKELNDKIKEIYTDSYQEGADVSFTDGLKLVASSSEENFGETISDSTLSVTDFIPLPSVTCNIQISVSTNTVTSIGGMVLYDSSKSPIKGYTYCNRKSKETIVKTIYNIPSEAKYIRTSILKSDKENFVFRTNLEHGGAVGSVENYVNHIYNAKNYGAKSGEDISQILHDMLEDITNDFGYGIIYVPSGEYKISSSVLWKSNINLLGDGIGKTIFYPIEEVSAFKGNDLSNFTMEKFTIDGVNQTGIPPQVKGIFQMRLKNVTYRSIEIKNTIATGLGSDGIINGLIEDVHCDNCGRGGDLSNPTGAPGCSGIGIGTGLQKAGYEPLTIINCICNNCKQFGIFLETQGSSDIPHGISIVSCSCEGNRVGIGIAGGDSARVISCSANNNKHAGFTFDAGTIGGSSYGKRAKFIGCVATNNGKNLEDGYPEYNNKQNGFGWYVGNYDGIDLISCNAIGNLKSGIEIANGVKNLGIIGGEISENGEHGIYLNGNISNFHISPMLIKSNVGDGIHINGTLSKGFIKNISITGNNNGINKTESGNLGDAIISENFVYNNTISDDNIAD